MVTVGFTGEAGSRARWARTATSSWRCRRDDTARIQESHEFVYHFIADAVEAAMLELRARHPHARSEVRMVEHTMTEQADGLETILGTDWRSRSIADDAEIVGRVGGRTDVLLFGTGYLGRHVLAEMPGLPYRPVAFVDNNPALWGTEVEGLEVLSPEDAMADSATSVLWLITIYTNGR